MELSAFLAQYVECYGLSDLESMEPIRGRDGCGGVGYPMVMTCLSYVELLGYLTAAADLNPGSARDSKPAFLSFWQGFLYPDSPRRDVGDAVYTLARHGLAHVSMPKGAIGVTKNAEFRHLTWDPDRQFVVLDATQLRRDRGVRKEIEATAACPRGPHAGTTQVARGCQ